MSVYRNKNFSNFYGGAAAGYVYYKDLPQHGHKNLANVALSATASPPRETIAPELRAMANNELQKEKAWIKDVFGATPNVNFEDPNTWKDFVKTLNILLQEKEVLQRHIARLLALWQKDGDPSKDRTKTTIYAYFMTYFEKAWEELLSTLFKTIERTFGEANFDENLEVRLEEKIRNHIKEKVLPRAFVLFGGAEATTANLSDEEREELGSLRAISESIAKLKGTHSSFLSQVYELYNLDQLTRSVIEDIRISKTPITETSATVSSKAQYQKGGVLAEFIEGAMVQALGDKQIKMNGKNIDITVKMPVKTKNTGSAGYKQDMVYTFGVDMAKISDKLYQYRGTSRRHNAQAFKRVQKELEDLKDGYVVYVNAKDYNVKGQNFNGFQNDKDIRLGNLRGALMVGNNLAGPMSPEALVGQIAQLIPGAVGDNRTEEVKQNIAASIGWMLFDDLETVGKSAESLKGIQGNQIHLFYLSGFYYPLSVFLNQLADAFGEVESNSITSLVKVDITTPNYVKFGPIPENQSYKTLYDKEGLSVTQAWNLQKSIALRDIQISTHFLANFKNTLFEVFG